VRGLFVEIAEECRQAYGEHTRLTFLCGRDAAERIAGWDYGQPGAFARMLEQFDLLVAARHGEYTIPEPFRHAIQSLPLGGHFDHISASQVRDRIREGGSWEHLVPPEVRECVAAIYCVTGRPMDSTRGT